MKVDKKALHSVTHYTGITHYTASVNTAPTTFLPNLDRCLTIGSFWSGLRLESWFKIPYQCSIELESSLSNLSMWLLNVVSRWSGWCHLFRVLLWRLPRVAYQEVVATFLMECYSFFSMDFGYITDTFHDVNFPIFFCSEWKNGVLELCVERVWGWQ